MILVGVVVGSVSDWPTAKAAVDILEEADVPHEINVLSAHRTPDFMLEYAERAAGRGLEVLIAVAGGAAHLPGMVASKASIPVLGVPVQTLLGLDSLLSIVQMPKGCPVGTLAIGESGAANAALLAIAILGNKYQKYRDWYDECRRENAEHVLTCKKPWEN